MVTSVKNTVVYPKVNIAPDKINVTLLMFR